MKHTNRKQLLLISLATLLFCSFTSSSFASTNQQNSTPQKNIIATLDSKNFQIETSIHVNNIQSEPVYIALILDSSNSMQKTNDIWDSNKQQWIYRFEAASQAIQPIIDQASDNTFLAVYKYDQIATRLTTGFESIYREDGTRNARFSPDSDHWVFNQYQFGKNSKTNLSNGLKLAYEDMSLVPEHSKRYVIIINDSVDIAQGDSQTYATALKSPQNTQVIGIGYGQQAEVWSILLGHDNNVNIGSWAFDWKNTTVDTGTGDGFPNAEWHAWTNQNQNPNLIESRPVSTTTELHMITLSTALNPKKEPIHPTTFTLYNWWSFYRNQQEDNILELGNNVHYLYTMSLYGDAHVSLDEYDNIPTALDSKYTRNLTSLSENITQFNASIKNTDSTTVSGTEFFNPSIIEISNVSFFENHNSLSVDKIKFIIENGQLKWTILNATQGNVYSVRYQATTKNNTFEDIVMGDGSYIQMGSSDPLQLQSIKLPNMQTPIETPTPTVTPTATSIPTIEPTATPAPIVTPTATPDPTVAPTATTDPTVAPTATPIPTIAPTATTTIKQGGSVFSVVQEPVTTSVNIAPPVNIAAPVNIAQQNNNQLPQAATTVPNTTNTTNQAAVLQTEKIDIAETEQLKGKSLQVTTTRTAILTSPKEKSKPNAYIKQGKEFKIIGATENYLVIQYKVKDSVSKKGYVAKKDVQIVSSQK